MCRCEVVCHAFAETFRLRDESFGFSNIKVITFKTGKNINDVLGRASKVVNANVSLIIRTSD